MCQTPLDSAVARWLKRESQRGKRIISRSDNMLRVHFMRIDVSHENPVHSAHHHLPLLVLYF